MEKRKKFIELAEKRVSNTIKNIQLIGNLSNDAVYEYSEEDIKKIFRTLKEEIQVAELKFKTRGRSSNFKLK